MPFHQRNNDFPRCLPGFIEQTWAAYTSHGLNIVITTTFVSLLAMPIVGPALPWSKKNSAYPIETLDGWSCQLIPCSLFSSQSLATSQTDLAKGRAATDDDPVFSVGGDSLAPSTETISRFGLQGTLSAIATLNIALVPDLFSGRDRLTVMGWTGVVQGIGSGILP